MSRKSVAVLSEWPRLWGSASGDRAAVCGKRRPSDYARGGACQKYHGVRDLLWLAVAPQRRQTPLEV